MMNEVTKFVMKQKRARRFSPKFKKSDERRENSSESDFEDVPGQLVAISSFGKTKNDINI